MRYQKTDVEERKCTICKMNEVGDEWHCLKSCKNKKITFLRQRFQEDMMNIIPQLRGFGTVELIKYCMLMHDRATQIRTAIFTRELLNAYDEEVEEKEGCCSIM